MLYGSDESYELQSPEPTEEKQTQFIIEAYNPSTKKHEAVVVTEAVYNAYRRSAWRVENNDTSFFDHEIQQSSMSPNGEISIESIREAIDEETDVAFIALRHEEARFLHMAISRLPPDEQDLVRCLFFQEMNNAEYGRLIGTSGQAVGQKKARILKKLKKLLEKDFRN